VSTASEVTRERPIVRMRIATNRNMILSQHCTHAVVLRIADPFAVCLEQSLAFDVQLELGATRACWLLLSANAQRDRMLLESWHVPNVARPFDTYTSAGSATDVLLHYVVPALTRQLNAFALYLLPPPATQLRMLFGETLAQLQRMLPAAIPSTRHAHD